MNWSRIRPFKAGNFWFREKRDDQPVSLEVFYKGAYLYAMPPSQTMPVPLSEIEGEWHDAELLIPTEGEISHGTGRFIRSYPLTDTLTLIFTDTARMFVRYCGESPGGGTEITDYDASEFDALELADQSLSELVAVKLEEILPLGGSDETLRLV